MSSGATISTRSVELVRQLLLRRRREDVRQVARHLNRLRLLLGRRREDVVLDDLRARLRTLRQIRHVQLARVGDHSGEERRRGDRRRAEVDVVVGGSGAALEVAVERAQRVRMRGRRLSHADARAAGRLEHANAGHQQLDIGARARDLVEDLARARGRRRRDEALGDPAAAEDGADDGQILVGRVDRGADADLRERRADELFAPVRRCRGRRAWRSAASARRGRCAPPRRSRRCRRSGSSVKSSARCCSSSQRLVSESAGKIAPVAPSSAIMFAIVPRSV